MEAFRQLKIPFSNAPWTLGYYSELISFLASPTSWSGGAFAPAYFLVLGRERMVWLLSRP